jgi:rSAM/selenodomain-associated transferase 2/rSAM/selenodomain-associated transferase 1
MPEGPLVSVVIPVWRDEAALSGTLQHVQASPDVEVIVACALGEEPMYERLRATQQRTRWVSTPRGRAIQMNGGAAVTGGRWLLFLHADSTLPSDWLTAIRSVDNCAEIIAGAFKLRLDSPDWRARIVEGGVRIRVALLGLPYGDQALFVRRGIFETIGGYRDMPLMEDIDLVRRLKKVGRVVQCASFVVTSARRWEREGWLRRSGQNFALATQFLFGAQPARLAQVYFGRKAAAVVMMGRAPWTAGKTRLGVKADDGALADLRHALFLDTLDAVMSVHRVEHLIACEPPDACERVRTLAGGSVDVIAQRGDDLGQRLANVFEDTFRLGFESVIVIGSDLPDLPPRLIREAVSALRNHPSGLVLGPATDGGYYLIGMNRPHPRLFQDIEWSSVRVVEQTMEAANAIKLSVVLIDKWTDVDDVVNLRRVVTDGSRRAGRTRAWGIEHYVELFGGGQTLTAAAEAGASIGQRGET